MPIYPAAFSEDVLFLMIPMIAVVIVSIWAKHRVQIEELRARQTGDSTKLGDEVAALRGEVRELKEQMHQQLIAVDNLLSAQQKPSAELPNRLDAGNC
jgi:hypothetical protein